MRLDKFLVVKLKDFSRSQIQSMIRNGQILVNNKKVKAGFIVSDTDKIHVKEKSLSCQIQSGPDMDFDIDIIDEGSDYFIINKPQGLLVHRTQSSHSQITVSDVFSEKINKNAGDSDRPGIVHRLDKDTSGALIIAKNASGYNHFIDQFKNRKIKKIYIALVKGLLEYKNGIIDSPIGRNLWNRKKMDVSDVHSGKFAISQYKVIEEFKIDKNDFVSLVEIDLKTGRTHQIRVHMAAIHHPVVGDKVYGISGYNNKFERKFGLKRQFLHAYKLEFLPPDLSGKKIVKAIIPKDLKDVLKLLKNF